MENDSQTPAPEPSSKNKRKRGVFPRLSLKKTLELPRAIYSIGQGEPVRRVKVFDHLGKSAGSGPSRNLVTVSGMYGLTNGGFQAEYLEITDLGKKLAVNEDMAVIYEILFKNDIFSKFIEYWKDKVFPENDIASDWLLRTFRLVPEDAQAIWGVIKENILDYHLTEQLSGKTVITSKEIALKNYGAETVAINDPTSTQVDLAPKILETLADEKHPVAMQAVDIDLENGGKARIVVPSHKEITKADVKKMKAQIDIFSNFIDQEK